MSEKIMPTSRQQSLNFFGEMRGLNEEERTLYNEAWDKDTIVYDINFWDGWDNMEEFLKWI